VRPLASLLGQRRPVRATQFSSYRHALRDRRALRNTPLKFASCQCAGKWIPVVMIAVAIDQSGSVVNGRSKRLAGLPSNAPRKPPAPRSSRDCGFDHGKKGGVPRGGQFGTQAGRADDLAASWNPIGRAYEHPTFSAGGRFVVPGESPSRLSRRRSAESRILRSWRSDKAADNRLDGIAHHGIDRVERRAASP